MPNNRFWHLLAKKLSGEATHLELAELDELLRQNPDWGYAASHIEDVWKQKPAHETLNAKLAYELHLENLHQNGFSFSDEVVESSRPNQKSKHIKLLIAAVSVAAVLVAVMLLPQTGKKDAPKAKWEQVVVKSGTRTRMLLPDSTIVHLNAGSGLRYEQGFGVTNRNLELIGEGYFDVRKMKLPMLLRAGNVTIRVLGTAFNVRAYADDAATETSLLRGSVEIMVDDRPGERYLLRPKEKLIVNRRVKVASQKEEASSNAIVLTRITPTQDTGVQETAWVQNQLLFQNESFASLVPRLERWYNVRIFLDDRLRNERITGKLETESVAAALEALQLTTNFSFVINKDSITITK